MTVIATDGVTMAADRKAELCGLMFPYIPWWGWVIGFLLISILFILKHAAKLVDEARAGHSETSVVTMRKNSKG
jgi:hypothetical protein